MQLGLLMAEGEETVDQVGVVSVAGISEGILLLIDLEAVAITMVEVEVTADMELLAAVMEVVDMVQV